MHFAQDSKGRIGPAFSEGRIARAFSEGRIARAFSKFLGGQTRAALNFGGGLR